MDDIKKLFNFLFNKVSLTLVVLLLSINAISDTFLLGDLAPRGAPDGQLNAADLLIMERIILGDIFPTSDELLIGDVAPLGAHDGTLNAGDLVVQARAVMGEITLGTIDISSLPKPTLDPVVSPTTSNPYLITGTASPGSSVDIYVEGSLHQSTVNSDGTFSNEVYLFDGLNNIYAVENNGVDISPQSNTLLIQYNNIISRTQSGTITENTVWTPGSPPQPYVIAANLTVQAGVNFVIQPGAELRFESGAVLYVLGDLNIAGTVNNQVVFTSNKAQIDKNRGDWQGIQVRGSSSVVNIDQAKIEYANYGIYFDTRSNGVAINSILQNNNVGVYVTSANDVALTDLLIQNNGSGVLLHAGVYTEGGKAPFIGPNNIITSNFTGVDFRRVENVIGNPEATIRGNKIFANTYDVDTQDLQGGYLGNNINGVLLDLRGNYWGTVDYGEIVVNMRSTGFYSNPKVIYDVTGYLDENGIADTAKPLFGSLEEFVTFQGSGPLQINQTYLALSALEVEPNTTITIPEGVTIEFSKIDYSLNVRGVLNITGVPGNLVTLTPGITDNAVYDWKGIKVEDGGVVTIDHALIEYALYGASFEAFSSGSVTNSELVNNNTGIAVYGDGINVSRNPLPIITNNSIYGNVNDNYYTSSFVGTDTAVLDATNNWWGTTDVSAIELEISDWNDNSQNKVIVNFSDFLASEGGGVFTGNDPNLLLPCPVVRITDDSNFIDSYPADNIGWTGANYNDVLEIEKAFNHARFVDSSITQYLDLPEQAVWDGMSIQEKGLYLINSERQARDVKPYEGVNQNIVTIAQNYADYIRINNQVIGHYNDGNSPVQRLEGDAVIAGNTDLGFYPESINAAYGATLSTNSNKAVIEAVYTWIYFDKLPLGGTAWGHRDHILQVGLNENSGITYQEGLIGFGVSTGNYDPTGSAPSSNGSVVVLNTIDPASSWDHSTTQQINVDSAQLCNNIINIEIDETAIPINQIKSLEVVPSDIYLLPGSTASLQITATYLDGSTQDITSVARFVADNLSIVNIDAGTVTGQNIGYVYASVNANGVKSNTVFINVAKATDLANLNGTAAESFSGHVPVNATVQEYDSKTLGVFTGKVADKSGTALPDVSISIHNSPEYGSVLTDSNGDFILATGAGEQRLVYRKPGYLTIHRTAVVSSNDWSVLDDVIMLPVDAEVTQIDLSLAIPQTHKSTVITDSFGSRSTTLVFNGITSATVTSIDGTERALTDFSVRATEYELPQSMPAELPKESAFTYCSELQIPGVRDDETVTFDNDVIMYVDNFLSFNVGEIVPIGYYDRQLGDWVASDNGIVVKLLDTDSNGIVDGLDISGDSVPDDLNQNGSTTDEVAGVVNYPVGATYWRGSLNHFTPFDFNWPYKPAADAVSRGDFVAETSNEDKKQKEFECTGSYVKPETQSFHEDIKIAGTDLTLHYSSQRTAGYKHMFNVKVSGNTVPASMLQMLVKLEIGGNVFEQTLAPEVNKEAEFIWDGNDPTGKRIEGAVQGTISIGYKYNVEFVSAGTASSPAEFEAYTTAWAQVGGAAGISPGRDDFITWSSSTVSVHNTYDNQLAEGWSISNHQLKSPIGQVYLGNGEVIDTDKTSLILKTGITTSLHNGDDGYYQKGGSETNYSITKLGTLIDNVTGLEWQYTETPKKYTDIIAASNYCNAATFAIDKDGWRLPTDKEITYTVDKSGGKHALEIYEILSIDNIWHATNNNPDDKFLPVYCVKGETLNNRYIADLKRNDTAEIVIDEANGLMWLDDTTAVSNKLSWTDSIDYCEALTHTGYDDWRLPNINELAYTLPNSVFQNQTTYPAGQPWGPTSPDRNPYWASTPYAGFTGYSWAMESAGFSSPAFSNTDLYNVRCVRDNIELSPSPYRFDTNGRHLETVDLASSITLETFSYGADGKLRVITNRFGDAITITGDPVIDGYYRITTQDGYTTTVYINSNNEVTSVKYDDNSEYTFTYTTGALLEAKTEPNGNIFTHVYNPVDGRVTQTSDQEGGIWDFFSSRQGNQSALYGYTTAELNTYQTLRTILDNGDVNKSTTLFDGTVLTDLKKADDLKQTLQACSANTVIDNVIDSKTKQPIPGVIIITQPSGLESITQISKSYGSGGADVTKQTITTNQNGKTSSVFTDSKTGETIFTSAEGRTTILNTDPVTLLLQTSQTPGLLNTSYTYDTRGRQKTITTGARTTTFTYNPVSKGDVTYITADDGKQTHFEYDVLGRASAIVYPGNHRTENQYDENGNLTTLVIPTTVNHGFSYNGVNKVKIDTKPKDGIISEVTQYDYDTERNLKKITLPSAKVISNTYINSLLDQTTTPEGTIDYSYTCNKKIESITEGTESITYGYDGSLLKDISYSGTLSQTIGYSYNTDFNVTALSYAGLTTNYGYDDDGLLTSSNGYTITRNAQNGLPESLSNGTLQQTRSFNGYGEAETVTTKVNNKDIYAYTLGYNDLGKITTKTETLDNGTVNTYIYSYDDRRRLDTVTLNGILIEDYSYDENGNRLTQTNDLRGISNQSASYNLGDQLKTAGSSTYDYDADGYLKEKVTTSGITTYQYSSQGRLLQVQMPDKIITYQHNAIGNRVAKLVDGIVTEKYLWLDKTTLLATYDKDDVLLQRYQYTDGNTPDSVTQGGQMYYIVTDHLGTLRAITDSSGVVIRKISYDSFGNVITDSNPSFTIPFGFAGGLWDVDTGLVRFGFRDYDPGTGRWTARDPIGFEGGDTNLYGYTFNDPVNLIDENGLWSVSVGAFLGVGGGINIAYKNGTLETTGRIGVGLGGGIFFDPVGEPSPHSKETGSGHIARTSVEGGVDFGVGPFSVGATGQGSSGNGVTTPQGGGFTTGSVSTFSSDGKWAFGFKFGGSVGVDIGGYTNWGRDINRCK